MKRDHGGADTVEEIMENEGCSASTRLLQLKACTMVLLLIQGNCTITNDITVDIASAIKMD